MLDDVTSVTLQTALSALSQQQRVSANNIANLETPGFQAGQISFEDSLRSAVAAGNPTATQITSSTSTAESGVNGNNVSLSGEIITEEKTDQQYQLLTTAMSAKFDLLSDVLKA